MSLQESARYPLTCPHCGAMLDATKRHCNHPECAWILCRCKAIIRPGGFHGHASHDNTRNPSDCKNPPRSPAPCGMGCTAWPDRHLPSRQLVIGGPFPGVGRQ